MVHDTKMSLVFNKSIPLKKEQIASYAAKAALQFLIVNSENKANKLIVELSNDEAQWLDSPDKKVEIIFVKNGNDIHDLTIRAGLNFVECYVYTIDELPGTSHDIQDVVCAVLGPDDSELIDKILKS